MGDEPSPLVRASVAADTFGKSQGGAAVSWKGTGSVEQSLKEGADVGHKVVAARVAPTAYKSSNLFVEGP